MRLLRDSDREKILEALRLVPFVLFLLTLGAILLVSEEAADAGAEAKYASGAGKTSSRTARGEGVARGRKLKSSKSSAIGESELWMSDWSSSTVRECARQSSMHDSVLRLCCSVGHSADRTDSACRGYLCSGIFWEDTTKVRMSLDRSKL